MLKQGFNYKRQKGFSFFAWVAILALFFYFAYLALILSPVMISSYTADNILQSLENEPEITKRSNKDILRLIGNRLQVNQVENVSKDDFEIIREGNTIEIFLEYDDKVHFLGDIYILFERNKHIELTGN